MNMTDILYRLKNKISEEDGIGTIEVILILVVIIALVLVFKNQILALVDSMFGHINSSVNDIY